ncbi:7tm 1 domain containing protein [Trichuris trichiura]|uniref:7tm 1 domain containing protein n=1 Tax=Trichuris trichiura TaxID=36087 RepID=A0A077Z1I7_TRITR|nr:7tm 1 domain containing protein [Trichuris trichiura]
MGNTTGNASNLSAVINKTCREPEVLLPLEKPLFQYVYPIILFVCVLGNSTNLVVYQHRFLRASPTIRLLAVKAVVNTLCIMALLTVAVTVESYILVAFPAHAKRWCSMRNANLCILLCFAGAAGLQMFYLISRRIKSFKCSDSEVYYYLLASGHPTYEVFYYWFNSISTLLLPMVAMLVLTAFIYHLLFWARNRFRKGSEQKRCVTRLSLATTACHLVFEMPHVANFIIAATEERPTSQWHRSFPWLTFVATANFLSMLDASVTFVVYFLCSQRFRQIWFFKFCGKKNENYVNQLVLLQQSQERSWSNGTGPRSGYSVSTRRTKLSKEDATSYSL